MVIKFRTCQSPKQSFKHFTLSDVQSVIVIHDVNVDQLSDDGFWIFVYILFGFDIERGVHNCTIASSITLSLAICVISLSILNSSECCCKRYQLSDTSAAANGSYNLRRYCKLIQIVVSHCVPMV